jgi:hypothetical protein
VVSEADGRFFKLKHGGEELGRVPEQVQEVVDALSRLQDHELLPPGLLEVFQNLLQVVRNTKPPREEATRQKAAKRKQQQDTEAFAVFESALTKIDHLDSIFGRGAEAKTAVEHLLVEQVAVDLVKDYNCNEETARQRAVNIVKMSVGRRFGEWKKMQRV